MQRRLGVMALFLASCTVPAIGQTPPSGSESQASWTFDTFTPGPCSPTGAGQIYIAVERDTQLGPGSTRLTPTGSILRITPAH